MASYSSWLQQVLPFHNSLESLVIITSNQNTFLGVLLLFGLLFEQLLRLYLVINTK
jgi:hypothetical protein